MALSIWTAYRAYRALGDTEFGWGVALPTAPVVFLIPWILYEGNIFPLVLKLVGLRVPDV